MPNTKSIKWRRLATPSASRRLQFATRPPSDGYHRERDLPHLVPLMADDLLTLTPERHLALLALIRRVLRAERRRAWAGDWSYDLGRHAALIAAYRHELDLFKALHSPVPTGIRTA